MSSPDQPDQVSGVEDASKLDAIEDYITNLVSIQVALDNCGFSLASIHLDNAIEVLRAEQARIRLSLD